MKIYVASSWRCEYQPEAVRRLRALGHEVYDFRGPGTGWGEVEGSDGGFHWSEVDPNWKSWLDDVPRYLRGLQHPRAIEGYNRDMDALRRADACILVNPCGQSAHAELGWAAGAGKQTAAWCPAIREPDLMLKMAGYITDKWEDIERWLPEITHRTVEEEMTTWAEVEKRRQTKTGNYQDPSSEMLKDPLWNAIYEEIRDWDINVPSEYTGYCGALGNHATAIYNAIGKLRP
jgi:hypothetical protein